jgi:hypothetical protein
MKSKLLGLTITATISFGLAGPAAATTYSVQTVTAPASNFTYLFGINNGGTIAGSYGAAIPQGFTLVLPNTFTGENFPGATSTTVTAINSSGDTAGFYTDTTGNTHGFTKIGGTFTTLDNPNSAVFNQALGINNAQTTVGYYAPTPAGTTGQIAYSQSGGTFTSVNALLPPNVNSQAVGINSAGAIVGFYMPTATISIGFLDNGGAITPIDPFGSLFSQALGINSAGEIVGFYDAGGVQHGYIDDNGNFTTFDPSGSQITTISGVNDLGQIVGFYTDANDDVVGFVGSPTPTPIPLALPLFATGLGAIGLLGWRRKRKNALAAA